MYTVLAVNGSLVTGILGETVYVLSRAWIDRSFMQDSKFLNTHLGLLQHQKRKFEKFIRRTKTLIERKTSKLFELQSPFLRNPGDDTTAKTLTLDQIYTNLVVVQNRETYNFAGNREDQLRVYPRSRGENSRLKSLEDLLSVESKKILIVGRPGIGKTLCCIKLLRDWATTGTTIHFDAAFFVKFRRFNSAKNLSLRELLIQSEYFPTRFMDNGAWNHLLENPEYILIVFDGFDEFEHNKNMAVAAAPPKSIEEKQPLEILYQWLVTGELLKDASIVTTTRPTALPGIAHLQSDIDKTFEIVGFSIEQIEEYINKFVGVNKQEGETLLRHISSNMNLLSLCYIPMNSFIVCSSLSEIIQFEGSDSVTLPSKLTTIYETAVKVFYFKHTKEFCDKHFTHEDFLSDDLPSDVQEKFEKLGRVAFEGIEEGKLILGGNKVRGMKDSALFYRLPNRPNAALKAEQQFCFIHLTMQEFFAARHLINNLREPELRNFVSENIKNGKWQLVFQFLAGFMEDKDHLPSEIITSMLPVKTEKSEIADSNEQWTEKEEKRMVICWPTKEEKDLAVTLIKCINENNSMREEAQEKFKKINFNCVNFIFGRLTAVDCSSLVSVINVQQISHFNLGANNIGPLGCYEICKLLKYQLSWLNLENNQLTDEAAKYLAEAIKNNCHLHTLNLSENNISDTGALDLAEAINNNCQLRTLHLRANNILEIGAQHLAKAINNNNCHLHTLDLSENNISDIGAQHLAKAISSNCQLHTLHLRANKISHIGAQHLAKAINNDDCQLHALDLSENDISDTGAQHLAADAINNNCQLRTLHLGANNISKIGAKHLAEAINNNRQLRTLNLTANNISDIGAQHFDKAISDNCQLHTLNLSENNISDIGAQHLAKAINTDNNCQLRTLIVAYNKITDIGAQHLDRAIKARNLLSNNQSKCNLIL